MTGLLDAIEDDGWRDWARRLPEPRHPEPGAVETYLSSLRVALENRPGPLGPLSRDARRSLLEVIAVQYDTIAYVLEREAVADEANSVFGAGSEAAALLGTVSPTAKAASVAIKAVRALGPRAREKRLEALRSQALNVRVLLLLLRKSLIAR